jgi:hypothetical protein
VKNVGTNISILPFLHLHVKQSARASPFLCACASDELDCSDRERGRRPADGGDGGEHGAGAGGRRHQQGCLRRLPRGEPPARRPEGDLVRVRPTPSISLLPRRVTSPAPAHRASCRPHRPPWIAVEGSAAIRPQSQRLEII